MTTIKLEEKHNHTYHITTVCNMDEFEQTYIIKAPSASLALILACGQITDIRHWVEVDKANYLKIERVA